MYYLYQLILLVSVLFLIGCPLCDQTDPPLQINKKVINFSGYQWIVKSESATVGPGPNIFSDSTDNVWTDDSGGLHLEITNKQGQWQCAEIISENNFGYGTYRFYLTGRVDLLNENVVFGLFTWDDDSAFNHREIDIEFSKLGDSDALSNAQFVVQPYTNPENNYAFNLQLGGDYSTHSFKWNNNSISFRSWHGHNEDPEDNFIIENWVYSGGDVPLSGNEKVHINLWLYLGEPPSDGEEVEIIVSVFEFIPLE